MIISMYRKNRYIVILLMEIKIYFMICKMKKTINHTLYMTAFLFIKI